MSSKTSRFALLIGLVLASLLLPAAALASESDPSQDTVTSEEAAEQEPLRLGEQVAIFRDLHISRDEIVESEIVCVGGDVVVEGDVYGQIVVVGGSLRLDAQVHGQVVSVLSSVTFEDSAQIRGDLIAVACDLEDRGVLVNGDRVEIPIPIPHVSGSGAFALVRSILAWVEAGRLLVILLTVLLLIAIMPERTLEMSRGFASRFGVALLLGFAVQLAKIVLIILLGISVIGAPLIPLLILGEWVLRAIGRVAALHFFGQRLGLGLGREMSLLGATLLAFLLYALLSVLPYFFGFLGLLFGLTLDLFLLIVIDWPGVGIVVLTRFGAPTPAGPEPAEQA